MWRRTFHQVWLKVSWLHYSRRPGCTNAWTKKDIIVFDIPILYGSRIVLCQVHTWATSTQRGFPPYFGMVHGSLIHDMTRGWTTVTSNTHIKSIQYHQIMNHEPMNEPPMFFLCAKIQNTIWPEYLQCSMLGTPPEMVAPSACTKGTAAGTRRESQGDGVVNVEEDGLMLSTWYLPMVDPYEQWLPTNTHWLLVQWLMINGELLLIIDQH